MSKLHQTLLTANFVNLHDDEDFFMIGFADDQFDTNKYLILQKAKQYSKQDIELGLDEIYISFSDEIHSAYGGIKHVILSNDLNVKLEINQATSKKLGTNQIIIITIDDSKVSYAQLKNYLEIICEQTFSEE